MVGDADGDRTRFGPALPRNSYTSAASNLDRRVEKSVYDFFPVIPGVIDVSLGSIIHLLGAYPMSNSPLSIRVTVSQSGAPMTANAGAVLVVQLLQQLGVLKETSPERSQGWLDGQMILSVVLMNLPGFNRVSDAEKLGAIAACAVWSVSASGLCLACFRNSLPPGSAVAGIGYFRHRVRYVTGLTGSTTPRRVGSGSRARRSSPSRRHSFWS